MTIPRIDVSPLFEPADSHRSTVDQKIFDAAGDIGFVTIAGIPDAGAIGTAAKKNLVQLFSLPPASQRALWKQNFEPGNPNLYRGWFPLQSGPTLSREGFEIGPDIVRTLPDDTDDLLYQPTPMPEESELPGFQSTVAEFFLKMEFIGLTILASLSRSLGIPETIFQDAFRDGISTLRLLRYIPRTDLPISDDLKRTRGEHVDSGLLTLLSFVDGGIGLQAQDRAGVWHDVPADDGTIAINFGGLMERWTGGRIRATRHGVAPVDKERFSIPFFFEPRPDTRIEPLPIPGIRPFEPFLFGDHLWACTTRFAENFGLAHLRPHKAPYRDPLDAAAPSVYL